MSGDCDGGWASEAQPRVAGEELSLLLSSGSRVERFGRGHLQNCYLYERRDPVSRVADAYTFVPANEYLYCELFQLRSSDSCVVYIPMPYCLDSPSSQTTKEVKV